MPVRDPDSVCVLDPLIVCVAVRLPVTVDVTVRLLVMLGKADRVDVEDGVMAAVFVGDIEAVRLLVRERLPVRDPVTVPVPVRLPV